MKRLLQNSPALATAFLGLGVLYGCRNDRIAGPAPQVPPVRAQTATLLGTYVIPPTDPANNETGLPRTATGIVIPPGWLVRVTVTGMLHFSVNSERLVCSSQPPVTPPGGLYDVGPYGFPYTLGWTYIGGGAEVSMDHYEVRLYPEDPSADSISGEAVAWGMVYVNRPASFPGSCGSEATGYQPDYFVTGQQTLKVELVAPLDTVRVQILHTPRTVAPTGIALDHGPPLLNGQPWPDTLYLNVTVDSAGNHLPNRTVNLSLQAIDSAGRSVDSSYGHIHAGTGGAQKPAGSLSQTTVSTGASGVAIVRFKAGTISGPVVVRATSVDADSAQDTLVVSVPALQALVQSQSDTLIGQNGAHPINHYGLQAMITRLNALADSFYSTYSARLYINDMSLSYGGKFDTDSSWSGAHDEHRVGRDADLRTNGDGSLDQGQRDYVWLIWERLGGKVHNETKTSHPHYHLRYRGLE